MSHLDLLIDIVRFFVSVINVWIFVSFLYYFVVGLWGFRQPKKYADQPPKSRFLVFIPACNEENVVGDVIRSIRCNDYPADLVDVYVIADNCRDNTAQIAMACGAQVIETSSGPGEPVGKPHAIKKVLEQYPDFYERYDLLVILDADNVLCENFLTEINSQYLSENQPAAIQGYLGCKNRSGVVAFFYYHSYTLTNRFFQLAKYRLGINCSIGGTGLAFSLQALQRNGGWQANSLTEDMEMQLLLTRRGERILWNHYARTYDEKPTSAATAFKQRTRWSQGHWYVSLHNVGPLLRAWWAGKISFGELISSVCYMFSMPMSLQIPLLAVLLALTVAMDRFHLLSFLGLAHVGWPQALLMALPFLYSLFVLFFVADWIDNRQSPRLSLCARILSSYLLMYPLCAASQVFGFLKHRNQRIWVKTNHKISPDQGAEKTL
ncbi:MAG: glycosyltransferase [Oscillospiraceae bacterium]|nr:glycosyltransferase [Oscillospiraceae bacterium]